MGHMGIGWFAREVLGKPLYPYQELVGDAILDSIIHHRGLTFTVMFARQMGKNQLSAILEAYLLCCMETGQIIKAAPTYQPQIVNSRLRLLSMLDNPLTRHRYWKAHGYMLGVAPTPEQRQEQSGPGIMFFSAGPDSNIVGATASLLLEIDEAQDVSIEKFDRDLRPMASTTNATTILYGTAWSEDTLLAITRANNFALEQQDGIQRNFHFDWRTLAAINPSYATFVASEIKRLGEEHITIRTQYCLQPISGAGFLLNEMQRYLLKGVHHWLPGPSEDGDAIYIASMDVGGEDRPNPHTERRYRDRDSTIITIARVICNELLLPCLEIVHQVKWTGKYYLEQYAETVALCERWGVHRIVIDKTGLGEVMCALLESKLGPDRVMPYHFTRPSKSKLTYQFLSMINSGRLKLYQPDDAPMDIYAEAWKQLKLARYRVPAESLLDMYVDPTEGHDDILISIALTTEAVRAWSIVPSLEASIIRPRLTYNDGFY